MAVIEKGSCLIEFINKQGFGSSKSTPNRIEIPYTLIGEIVAFEKHEYRKKSNYILKNIEKPSIHRVTPECKYFEYCGGCMLQHMDLESYNNFKLSLAQRVLPPETKINPLITIPKGNRRRINLQALKKDGRLFLGLRRFHSHQIVDIDICPAVMSELSAIFMPLKKTMIEILEHKHKAEIFLTYNSNGIDILFEMQNLNITPEKEKLLMNFAIENQIIRLQIQSPEQTKTIFESEKPYIMLGDKKVATDPKCFMQTSFESDKLLAGLVEQYLPEEKGKIVDLFCGRGTFSLPLSKRFDVDGFESDSNALEALENASEGTIILHQRDLFKNPLNENELSPYDFVVINPPRAGALEQIKKLANSKCKKIIYISCNPESFARDAAILEKGSYKLQEVTPVDQFYWSAHLEIAGVFERFETK
ncbi:methyltransferase [Rickettsiaceae bacterium]|nr:methyltransferase [Rickettsiaceae bacterium]